MADPCILVIDQGTSGTSAYLFDPYGRIVAMADREIAQHYPQAGWVEHDPDEIWQSALRAAREVLERAGPAIEPIALGITNQRETTVVWDRASGRPVARAVVWQCRRTATMCEELRWRGLGTEIQSRTGLVIDAYFSGTKIRWLLDHAERGAERAAGGALAAGTIDSWLLWNLTGGRLHATDATNASRTMLYNIHERRWDDVLCRELGVPPRMLASVRDPSGLFGETDPERFLGLRLPILGVAGDQQSALFGQACFRSGMAKNTYGTGCFLLVQTEGTAIPSSNHLLTTAACGRGAAVGYALEGSVFIAGAAVQWLRDGLGIIAGAQETEALARSVPDNGGVWFVPSFVGLAAPEWDMHARGTIVGLTRGATKAHLVRATLEAIAYQTRDVLEAMRSDGAAIESLRVDGGGSANDFLMQFQADVLGIPIERSAIDETTALGAAYLAGLAAGVWRSTDDIASTWRAARRYEPTMGADEREAGYATWKRAVERARGWAR